MDAYLNARDKIPS
jgi:hypothetical protein